MTSNEVWELDRKWNDAHGAMPPLGYLLREGVSERWARVHSLRGGARYPRNRSDVEAILERHRTVLRHLVSSYGSSPELWVTVPDGWDSPRVEFSPDNFVGLRSPEQWRRLVDPAVTIWVTRVDSSRPEDLDRLLARAASSDVEGVMIAPDGLCWIYCPYDGGADVILPAVEDVGAFKEKFREWLSDHPTGL